MADAIIETKDLCKYYGDFLAVDHLNLSIRPGEIYGLLGPNGAGKTTTILMILGLSEPSSGEVRVNGIDPVHQPLQVKRIVGYLPDNVGFYEDMTARENLRYTVRLNQMDPAQTEELIERTLARVGLQDAADKKVGAFSRGMRQRLGLADVLVKQPKIVILDEPTLGIDPSGIKELLGLIRQLSRDDGLTVLLSSHLLHQVQRICDRVGLFVGGKMLAEGSLSQLTAEIMGETAWLIEVEWSPRPDHDGQQLTEDDWKSYCLSRPEIESVEREGERWLLHSHADIRAELAGWLHIRQADLLHLNIRSIGLDDIYERYFGGDERRGKTSFFQRIGANRS